MAREFFRILNLDTPDYEKVMDKAWIDLNTGHTISEDDKVEVLENEGILIVRCPVDDILRISAVIYRGDIDLAESFVRAMNAGAAHLANEIEHALRTRRDHCLTPIEVSSAMGWVLELLEEKNK